MPSDSDAASETVAEAEIEVGRSAHLRVDIAKLIKEHVREGGVVTVDTDGVITFKSTKKEYSKGLSRVEAMIEARRGDGQGTQVPPARTESAKKRRDRARNTHENYIARHKKRNEERQRQAQEASTTATEMQATQATVMTVDLRGEEMNQKNSTVEKIDEEGTVVTPGRTALFVGPGKRRVVEASTPATASEKNKANKSKMAITVAKSDMLKAKRGLEVMAPSGKAKRQDVNVRPNASKMRARVEPTAGKATTAYKATMYMYKSKGITRHESKGETTSYVSAAYKALTRGERMLVATRG